MSRSSRGSRAHPASQCQVATGGMSTLVTLILASSAGVRGPGRIRASASSAVPSPHPIPATKATSPDRRAVYVHGNHKLEIFWSAVPGAILLLIAILQIRTWADIKYQRTMPQPDQYRTLASRGNVRVGLGVAGNDRNSGLDPLSAALRAWAAPRLNCSQV